MNDLPRMSLGQLLGLRAQLMREFRRRGVAGSGGNLTAELARFLFCSAYGWREAPRRERRFSAVGAEGMRYLVWGRRLHANRPSRHPPAIRDIGGYDTLAAALLDEDHRVLRAALIPHAVVLERSSFVRGTNSYRFALSDAVWRDARVVDATGSLRAVESKD